MYRVGRKVIVYLLSVAAAGFISRRFCVGEKMNDDFYASEKWKRKRAVILRRDGYMCQRCKKYGRIRPATIVHHIKELEDFPELALTNSNLESVCLACHNALHPEKGGRRAR